MLPKPTRNLYMPMNTYAYIMISTSLDFTVQLKTAIFSDVELKFMFSMMLYVELKFASKRTLRQHTGAKSRHAIFDGQLPQHAAQMLPKPTRNLYMPMNTHAYIMILD